MSGSMTPSFDLQGLPAGGAMNSPIMPGQLGAYSQQATLGSPQDGLLRSPGQAQGYYMPPAMPSVSNLLASPVRRQPQSHSRPHRSAAAHLKKHCNCKNSRCLKLYCECFASGRYCEACNCVNCCNNRENEAVRQNAVEAILERNPNAFRPKIQPGLEGAASAARHNKGCNCKKSGCLKKYCECFQAGIYCSDNCKCIDCKNFEGSEARDAVMVTQQAEMASRVPSSPPPVKRPRYNHVAAMQQQQQAGAGQPQPGLPAPGGAVPLSPHQLALLGPAMGKPVAPPPPAAAPPSVPDSKESVGDGAKRRVIAETCSLLWAGASQAVAAIAPDQRGQLNSAATPSNGMAQPGAMPATTCGAEPANGAATMSSSAKENEGKPAADGAAAHQQVVPAPAVTRAYEAAEGAVLAAFHRVLRKIVDKVQPRGPDGAPLPPSQPQPQQVPQMAQVKQQWMPQPGQQQHGFIGGASQAAIVLPAPGPTQPGGEQGSFTQQLLGQGPMLMAAPVVASGAADAAGGGASALGPVAGFGAASKWPEQLQGAATRGRMPGGSGTAAQWLSGKPAAVLAVPASAAWGAQASGGQAVISLPAPGSTLVTSQPTAALSMPAFHHQPGAPTKGWIAAGFAVPPVAGGAAPGRGGGPALTLPVLPSSGAVAAAPASVFYPAQQQQPQQQASAASYLQPGAAAVGHLAAAVPGAPQQQQQAAPAEGSQHQQQ